MGFQPVEEFLSLYPLDEFIGEGCQGCVNRSGKFAVKRIQRINFEDLHGFISEIGFGTKLSHPNILKPVSWSYDDDFYYIAFPLGMELILANDSNLFHIDEMLSGLESAFKYMHSLGIIHADVREDNMIYHEGLVKLIDFGMSFYSQDNQSDYDCLLQLVNSLHPKPYTEKLQYFANNVRHVKSKGLKRPREDMNIDEKTIAHLKLTQEELHRSNLLFSKCSFYLQPDNILKYVCICMSIKFTRFYEMKYLFKSVDLSKIVLFILKTLDGDIL
jgi:serine/threonine protein kinase